MDFEALNKTEIDMVMSQARIIRNTRVNGTKIIMWAEDHAWKMADEIDRLRALTPSP